MSATRCRIVSYRLTYHTQQIITSARHHIITTDRYAAHASTPARQTLTLRRCHAQVSSDLPDRRVRKRQIHISKSKIDQGTRQNQTRFRRGNLGLKRVRNKNNIYMLQKFFYTPLGIILYVLVYNIPYRV